MIQYIYFVKCPDCEDEHFDFFDEAKTFALSELSKKPIITQVEVDRNDFGECVDSTDLGTIWSWEEVVKDLGDESKPVFTKSDLEINDDDPEFLITDDILEVPAPAEDEQEPATDEQPVTTGRTIKDLVKLMEENEDEAECRCCYETFPK